MKKLFILIFSIVIAGELEVDGDLKVNGTVDAQGNPITNVGAPQTLTDAVNAGILASALSDEGVYEYKYYYIAFATFTWEGWDQAFAQGLSKYKSIDFTDEGTDWQAKIDILSDEGWIIMNQFVLSSPGSMPYGVYGTNEPSQAHLVLITLKRKIDD